MMTPATFNNSIYALIDMGSQNGLTAELMSGVLQGWVDVMRDNIKKSYNEMEEDIKNNKFRKAQEIIANANKPQVVEEGAGSGQAGNPANKPVESNGNGAAANQSGTGQADANRGGDGLVGQVDNIRPISKSRPVSGRGKAKRRS